MAEPTQPTEQPKGEKRVVAQLRLMVDADDVLVDEVMATVKKALGKNGYRVTITGGNYLIHDSSKPSGERGLVCLPEDYDPEKRDFREGRFPPPWAQTPSVQDRIRRQMGLPSGVRQPAHLLTVDETLAKQRAEGKSEDPNRDGRLRSSRSRGSDYYSSGSSQVSMGRRGTAIESNDEELEFSMDDFKKKQGEAESTAKSAASDVAGAFKKRLKKNKNDKG